MDTIADSFLELGSDESSCFGFIQAKTSRQSTLSKKAELFVVTISYGGIGADTIRYLVEGEFFVLSGCEAHTTVVLCVRRDSDTVKGL